MFSTTWRSLTASFAAVAMSAGVATAQMSQMEKKPREAIGVVKMKYRIVQGDRVTGSEEVTRTTYNDNTIVFDAQSEMNFVKDMTMSATTQLMLQEESYFPLRFDQIKHMRSNSANFDHKTTIEMFANVAVVTTELNNRSETQNITVPTGTLFYELGTVHYLYQLLFWYDVDTGGRQSFSLLDISSKKIEDVVLYRVRQEPLEVMGKTMDTWRFEFEQKAVKISFNVDADGRIVRVDQPGTAFLLDEWVEDKS